MATTALSIENQWDFSGLAFLMKDLVISGTLFIGGNGMSSTELGFLDGVTAGTATASKAVVLDSSKGIATITSATITTLTSTTIAGAPLFSAGVGAAGGFSVSGRVFHTGGEPAIATTSGTNLDVVATETYRAEVFVPANFSSTGVAIFNGTAVAGNVQCWLLDSTGTIVPNFATVSTVQTGTTAFQRIPWSGGPFVLKGPATYWLAVQGNNAGADLRTHVVGNFGADKQTSTVFGTITVAAAPTTFTTGLGVLGTLY